MLKAFLWIFRVVVFILLLLFALLNTGQTPIDTLFWGTLHAPLVLVLVVVFGLGVMLGVASVMGRSWRDRRELLRLKHIGKPGAPPSENNPPSVPSIDMVKSSGSVSPPA